MNATGNNDLAGRARKWWLALQPKTVEDGRRLPGDRAALARLRRCCSVLEAASEPATAKLFRDLGLTASDHKSLGRVAALAAVLAHVRDDAQGERVAVSIGVPPGGEEGDARVKRTRFKHLVTARGDDEILAAFRRVVGLLDHKVNVKDLARQILSWTDDEQGDRARTRFAFDYHGAGFAAPKKGNTETQAEKD